MKAAMLFTSTGPLVILTSYPSFEDLALVEKLKGKGIEKFIAYNLPVEKVRERYGGHFAVVMEDLRQSDDLRVIDFNGDRIFGLFRFEELGERTVHERA